MATVVFEERLEVPAGISSLADFRRWALSGEFPETGRIDFVDGRIEVDTSPEELFCHGTLKSEILISLGLLLKQRPGGYLFTDSTRVSSEEAGLSAEPDIVFVCQASIASGGVRLVQRAKGGNDRYVELEGAPDLIVEVVSDSSVRKDTERLPKAYFAAGVRELWLADARGAELLFQIHRRGSSAFESVPVGADGFQASELFGCSIRLDRGRDALGHWTFDLKRGTMSAE